MELFILKSSAGSWDSYHKFTIGIFSTIDLANEAKAKFISDVIKYKDRYSKEEIKRLSFLKKKSKEKDDFYSWMYNSDYREVNLETTDVEMVLLIQFYMPKIIND